MEDILDKTEHIGGKLRFETIEFTAGDGRQLNLKHAMCNKAKPKGPILLIPGSGVRANLFSAPVETTFVEFLCDNGYDVWVENWRASIDFEPCEWTLEQAGLYDHPQAVNKIIEITGAPTIKAVVHCQGSTSFMMSLIAGLVPKVNVVVSNAVSLHPVVPMLAKIKLKLCTWPLSLITPYIDPQWSKTPKTLLAKSLNFIVNLLHHECDNSVCKHTSFLYGSGHPTLWRHENLNPETHAWLSDEFAWLPTRFLKQINKSVAKGELQTLEHLDEIPKDLIKAKPKTSARLAFFSGKENVCFLPISQQKTFAHFDAITPNYHSFTEVEDYGHLCMFMGKDAAKDVFPLMLAELDR